MDVKSCRAEMLELLQLELWCTNMSELSPGLMASSGRITKTRLWDTVIEQLLPKTRHA